MSVNKFEGYHFVQPFTRPMWGFITYVVGLTCAHFGVEEWRSGVGFTGNSKNNIVTFFLTLPDQSSPTSFLERFIKNPTRLTNLKDYIEEEYKKYNETLQTKTPNSLSDDQLTNTFTYIYHQLARINLSAIVLRALDYALIQQVKNMLSAKGVDDTGDAIATLSVTEKELFVTQEENALLEIAARLENDELQQESDLFTKAVNIVWKKYRLTTYGTYKANPRSKKDYVQMILDRTPNASATLREKKKVHREALEKRNSFREKLNLEEDESVLTQISAEIPYLKDVFKEHWNKSLFYASFFFNELSQRANQPEEYVKNYWPNDITSALSKKPTPTNVIEKRIKHHIVLGIPDILETFEGASATKFEETYLSAAIDNTNEFTGRIASKGKVRGIAKIVHGLDDFGKVETGNIIVVGNTTPDYVVILKKVAGIVAEEGGVTAHVSVISREFQIPAVVGVAGATTNLQDGDRVEVDAEKGVVRVLSGNE